MNLLRTESWATESFEISDEVASAIAQSGIAAVSQPPGTTEWTIAAGSNVGLVAGDGWALEVAPRLSIPRLMFLLSYALDPKGWREDAIAVEQDTSLFAAIANGFASSALRAVNPAPLCGYRTTRESSISLRGRVLFGEQISRSKGLPIPIEAAFDEFTQDIPENQMLYGAALCLLSLPLIPTRTRGELEHLLFTLDGVQPTLPSADVSRPVATRLNEHYSGALALSELILRGGSVRAEIGSIDFTSFVFDMNQVFEDFLAIALGDALEQHGGEVISQYSGETLDVERRIRLKPDLLWREKSSGSWLGAIDAKYKRLESSAFPNADAYQMLAYCNAFGLSSGFLVYAKDETAHARAHNVRNSGVLIRVEAIDVEQDPEAVLNEVSTLASVIAGQSVASLAA